MDAKELELIRRYESGVADFDSGDVCSAFNNFLKLQEDQLPPELAHGILHWIALCYYTLGRYDEAIPLLLRFLEPLREAPDEEKAQSSYLQALYQLATSHFELGQYEKAIDWYEAATKVFGLFAGVDYLETRYNCHLFAARSYQRVGDHVSAIRELDASLSVLSNYDNAQRREEMKSIALLDLCLSELETGNIATAEKLLSKITLDQLHKDVLARYLNVKLHILAETESFQEMVEVCDELRDRVSHTAYWGNTRAIVGIAYFNSGQYVDAKKHFESSLSVSPDDDSLVRTVHEYLSLIRNQEAS
ncbi:MAG TPA: tetratricopeptide repeat protein [candidate division Zixibacteria bacterium]|nr:tetratricopeptide repeat protein [candidate division Zixibacteria bacterium]